MNKVFISRSDSNVSWGFRLQGGSEYNEPLTITNIVPNSPADGKLDSGDMLIEIAGTNVTNMTHKNALELIQRCGNALFLTIHKVNQSCSPDTSQMSAYTERQHQSLASSYNYDVPSNSTYNTSSMHTEDIPQAPVFDVELFSSKIPPRNNRLSLTDEQSMETTTLSPILARIFSRSGGPKPFTYIPGGLDLTKIRESTRSRRSRDRRSISEDRPTNDQTMSRRTIVPPEQLSQHHYTTSNPAQPFSYSSQQPVLPKKYINHDTDVVTQCRSFQMLQGWISDSEKITPNFITPLLSQSTTNRSGDSQTYFNQQNNTDRRNSGSGGAASLPSRSFRYLQELYHNDDNSTNTTTKINTTYDEAESSRNLNGLRRSSDAHHPSRAFKYLQDQYDLSLNQSESIDNRKDLMEIYNKPPPSFREREPEAPRYKGATVPSRSFRFLQMMTHDDERNDVKPQQFLLNKYDQQNTLTTTNRIHEHPSRSFRYLQEMTGEQRPTVNRAERQNITLSTTFNTADMGASDF